MIRLTHATVGAIFFAFAPALMAQRSAGVGDVSLDSLLNVRVSAASKYAQTSAEAPASITILTSDELRQFAFRSMEEVLEVVRGFYVSNDRNYAYLGSRGFGRPTDYNNRILVLVDGIQLNEPVWGSAPVGTDLALNLDAVERIELMRGPGSASFGSNAMFGVINIVMKTAEAQHGVAVRATSGSAGTREAGVTAGRNLAGDASITVAGLVARSDGRDLHYREYDDANRVGITRGTDWEERHGLTGTLTWGIASLRGGYVLRDKGVPTGAYGSAYGDPRTSTRDAFRWLTVGLRRGFGTAHDVSIRATTHHYWYRGVYPNGDEPAYTDGGDARTTTAELVWLWDPSSRHRITMGAEHRDVGRASYSERFADGTRSGANAPVAIASAFAQHEWQLIPSLRVVSGLRFDRWSSEHDALTPRVALIATPDRATTIKALYGEAFRAPSAYEARLTPSDFEPNPDLKAERIQAYEVELQRRWCELFLVSASAYHYRMRNLIDRDASEATGAMRYANVASVAADGVELEATWRAPHSSLARAFYVWQQARDARTREILTNSPQHVLGVLVSGSVVRDVNVAVSVRHESERKTVSGTTTAPFSRSDLAVTYTPARTQEQTWGSADVSLRVTNLFDAQYSTPGGFEHRQAAITQNPRSWSLRVDWRF